VPIPLVSGKIPSESNFESSGHITTLFGLSNVNQPGYSLSKSPKVILASPHTKEVSAAVNINTSGSSG
jgi:hypothetical protein